ncbi:phospholipase C [Legionella lansingensis]|uniref:Uncharacterized protein n=1 Tax=Legionella lansingensis TaxID=45067 RepID=A0A0W0VPD9_9GAMM|nr:hypothetical protein [Legionella lansingensis]KTD22048.1 hypothetical protein Llan_1311 [Legionella lansingensis]SNV54135.1 phospholipase C [Legionella lansingensis]
MQLSVDSIYETFRSGSLPTIYEELSWLPNYDNIEQLGNYSPLFKYENGVLLKRAKNYDRYDYHWTPYWSGLITLLEFTTNSKKS